ncbi:MAG: hypothetical protein A2Y80_08850 [Deltaproteobacteria bacterium RBG_13_58_19]|nr:MAG: hypothetical protein A2Y80_08850 [Deltaproteobacteria bacterium RBG_13_58_19]
MEELAGHKSILKISKFADPDGLLEKLSKAGASSEELRQIYPERFLGQEMHEGNILVNVGIQGLWKLACDLASPPGAWSNANAKVRTGTGSGAAAATDTQATFTSPVDKAMDATYPLLSGQQIQFKGTYGTSDANQAWNEFGVINSDGTPLLLNRFVTSKGTKGSGEVWTLEIDITLT